MTLQDGHGLYVRRDEPRFLTGELVQHITMTAPPEELRERVRSLGKAGVKQIALLPTPGDYETFIHEFSEQIIARV